VNYQRNNRSRCSSCFFTVLILLSMSCICGSIGFVIFPDWVKDPVEIPSLNDVNPNIRKNVGYITSQGLIWVGNNGEVSPGIVELVARLNKQVKSEKTKSVVSAKELDYSNLSSIQAPIKLQYDASVSQSDREWMEQANKVIYATFGNWWPVEGREVKVSSRAANAEEIAAGELSYNPQTDEIVIFEQPEDQQIPISPETQKAIECHEITHAYTAFGSEGDFNALSKDLSQDGVIFEWVEGMAVMAEYVCLNTLKQPYNVYARTLLPTINIPEIAFEHSIMWNNSTMPRMAAVRYRAAGLALYDLYLQDPSFFKKFGQLMAQRFPDPTMDGITREAVWEVVAKANPDATEILANHHIMQVGEPSSDGEKLIWIWTGEYIEQLSDAERLAITQGNPEPPTAVFEYQVFWYDKEGLNEVGHSGDAKITISDNFGLKEDKIPFQKGMSFGAIYAPDTLNFIKIEAGNSTIQVTREELFQILDQHKRFMKN